MIIDGDRLINLLNSSSSRVVICAPFIKLATFKRLIKSLDPSINIIVVTRWLPAEVAIGISDLEVFDVIKDRQNSELRLLDNLHAKLYLADNNALVGSANVTASALGWNVCNNIELLIESNTLDPWVSHLMAHIDSARKATHAEREKIRAQAVELKLEDIQKQNAEIIENPEQVQLLWLPTSNAPERLFEVYVDNETTKMARSTVEDLLEDLNSLGIPANLNKDAFKNNVKNILFSLPSFRLITNRIPERISEEQGASIIQQVRPGTGAKDAKMLWNVVIRWISYFLSDDYEVAPTAFEVRLKSPDTT